MKNLKLRAFLLLAFSASHAFAIEVHGHRGARARYPENTLPAFEYAMKLGADYLEMDMAVTKDGVIVISHDPEVSGLICVGPHGETIKDPPLIHTLTVKQVQSYDCGTLKNVRFPTQTPVPGTHIPQLAQVFEMVQKSKDPHAKTIRFNIETKIFKDHPEYSVDPDTFVKKFLKVVKEHHMEDRVILQSFDMRTLDALRKYNQKIPLVALIEDDKQDMIQIAKDHHVDIISPRYTIIDKPTVEKLHAMNVKVVPWTADDESTWKSLIAMKVDGIISDDPEALLKYLGNR